MRILVGLATALFVLAVPAALVGGSVRFIFSYRPLYEYCFDRYRVADYTGIDRADLSRVATAMIDYFGNDEAQVNLEITQRGLRRPVFTEREVLHMVDVKALVRLLYRLQEVGASYVVVFALASFWRERSSGLTRVGNGLMVGSIGTAAGVGATAALSLVDFDQIFLQFHQLAFQGNDFWMLDPRIHNLIAMFPEPFWLDGTLALGGLILFQGALVWVVGWRVRRAGRSLT